MARGRAFSRHIFREKHRRQYTFTRTKLAIGFCVSLITSIFLGTYFEQFGGTIIKQSVSAVASAVQDEPLLPKATAEAEIPLETEPAPAQPSPEEEQFDSIAKRVENLKFSGESTVATKKPVAPNNKSQDSTE